MAGRLISRLALANGNNHYDIVNWVDFVRGHAAAELAPEMQEHLDRGCDSCGRTAGLWRRVLDLARREESFQAPHNVVRCAKALYSAFPPRKERSLRLHFGRLVGFNQPALEGVRGIGASASHYLYEEGGVLLDVRLEAEAATGAVSLVGQIVEPARREERREGRSVWLRRVEDDIARTSTDEFGEFQLQFMPQPDLLLVVELDDNSCFLSCLPPAQAPRMAAPPDFLG